MPPRKKGQKERKEVFEEEREDGSKRTKNAFGGQK